MSNTREVAINKLEQFTAKINNLIILNRICEVEETLATLFNYIITGDGKILLDDETFKNAFNNDIIVIFAESNYKCNCHHCCLRLLMKEETNNYIWQIVRKYNSKKYEKWIKLFNL
ncbi:MAG TPA: hypothetical protein VLG50_06610 [Candidatus Saccharimonadales bacterium]|nr:hypothetical protein [Candidatus Saccharimonadales bacterium]